MLLPLVKLSYLTEAASRGIRYNVNEILAIQYLLLEIGAYECNVGLRENIYGEGRDREGESGGGRSGDGGHTGSRGEVGDYSSDRGVGGGNDVGRSTTEWLQSSYSIINVPWRRLCFLLLEINL